MQKKPKFSLKDKLNRDVLFNTSLHLPRIIEIDMSKLRPNPDQPRKTFNEQGIEELAESIAQHGLISPISVAIDPEDKDRYIVVAGERRYRAFKKLGHETIPAILTSGKPDEIALIENIQREDILPVEEAAALAKMMERYGYTQEELGRIIGKARNTVNELLRLNTLPEKIKDECRTSDIMTTKSVLIQLSRLDSPEEQLRLWEEIKHGKTTVRSVRAGKESKRERESLSAVVRVLATARKLVQQLEQIPIQQIAEQQDQYLELLQLQRRISDRLNQADATSIKAR